MSPVSSPLRLVRPDDNPSVLVEQTPAADSDATLARIHPAGRRSLDRHMEAVQAELELLQREVDLLRRRDDTLKFYMTQLDEELRLAARLQRDFLPKALPQVGRVSVHALFRPAGYVSGDLYDVMRLDEQHVGFYMADAVGHGMPAALLTMFLKNALITKQITNNSYRLLRPGETMAMLNEALLAQNLSQATFATALYGMINTQTLQVSFARGGHPAPLLLRRDGTLISLEADGGLLGIFPDEVFTDGTAQLESGDRLFVFTDGIEVAFGEAQTDAVQWRGELVERRDLSGRELLEDFAQRLDGEAGSLSPKDDLTVVVIEAA
jgi:serine phosphatase RsbU (regulator of sigma subunit)